MSILFSGKSVSIGVPIDSSKVYIFATLCHRVRIYQMLLVDVELIDEIPDHAT